MLRIIICASRISPTGVTDSGEHKTMPGPSSLVLTPLSLIWTFSPGGAVSTSPYKSSSIPVTSVSTLFGINTTLSPTLSVPDSTLPRAVVEPRSLNRSKTGTRNASSGFLLKPLSPSSICMREGPVYHLHSLYCSTTLAPVNALIGTHATCFFGLNPCLRKKGVSLSLISLKRSSLHSTVSSSILLMATINRRTPSVIASMACSRVCPPRLKPDSNSDLRAEITSTPTSAWAAPEIMLGTYLACPGASRIV
mmetsp:Transcript_4333/g.6505  ORF Transcript_4333/g.6505 Transcript_4333/m.6505 type:complete len:251 (-) Transcript_4333:396-1148(-)